MGGKVPGEHGGHVSRIRDNFYMYRHVYMKFPRKVKSVWSNTNKYCKVNQVIGVFILCHDNRIG